MKKITLLTGDGHKELIIPAYYIDDQFEDTTYIYRIDEVDGDVNCTRLKVIEMEGFYSYSIDSTAPHLALSHKESNVLEWTAQLGRISDFLTKFI